MLSDVDLPHSLGVPAEQGQGVEAHHLVHQWLLWHAIPLWLSFRDWND